MSSILIFGIGCIYSSYPDAHHSPFHSIGEHVEGLLHTVHDVTQTIRHPLVAATIDDPKFAPFWGTIKRQASEDGLQPRRPEEMQILVADKSFSPFLTINGQHVEYHPDYQAFSKFLPYMVNLSYVVERVRRNEGLTVEKFEEKFTAIVAALQEEAELIEILARRFFKKENSKELPETIRYILNNYSKYKDKLTFKLCPGRWTMDGDVYQPDISAVMLYDEPGERVFFTYRGTISDRLEPNNPLEPYQLSDWGCNFDCATTPDEKGYLVSHGPQKKFRATLESIERHKRELGVDDNTAEYFHMGHSLGGGQALVSGWYHAQRSNVKNQHKVFALAPPPVFSKETNDVYERILHGNSLLIRNRLDPVGAFPKVLRHFFSGVTSEFSDVAPHLKFALPAVRAQVSIRRTWHNGETQELYEEALLHPSRSMHELKSALEETIGALHLGGVNKRGECHFDPECVETDLKELNVKTRSKVYRV